LGILEEVKYLCELTWPEYLCK